MSTYAISDLHGYPLEKFKALLKKVGFSNADLLYVIGDVIDRNFDGGVELLRYIMAQPNFEFLLGNHEDMLLACDFLFKEITDEAIEGIESVHAKSLERYLRNGGGVTLESLRKVHREEPEAFWEILDFLREAPIFAADTVGGRDFMLVHGGFPAFSPEKKLKDYDVFGLLWERPRIDDRYFDDITTIIGHTPTEFYGEEHKGKVLFTPTWINIDVSAAYGLPPALLRLDDLSVTYAEE